MADETEDLAKRPIERLWRSYTERVLSMDPGAGSEAAARRVLRRMRGPVGLLAHTGENNDEADEAAYQALCQLVHDELYPRADELASRFGQLH